MPPPSPPSKFHLTLLIHAHQPCGNFDHVFASCYEKSYQPFVDLLEKYPYIHAALHYSGPLLQWLEMNRPEYFEKLRSLVQRGQIEMVGGGFYEPILVSIPPQDQKEQITRLADYLEHHFGQRPKGAWLAERVWEPQLPSALHNAGVGYTLLDDIHFHSAGFESAELFTTYLAEDAGKIVAIFPGQKKLRYLLPFGGVDEAIAWLREAASAHPGGVAAMGDDMEKFGVWPETHKHCYIDGWLDNFFTAIAKNSDWLQLSTPSEYLAHHHSHGRADLPTASYTEMMEWVLPTDVRLRYQGLLKEFSHRPEVITFLRGGPWRAFFRKYSESNLLNKKMLRVSSRLASAPQRRSSSVAAHELLEARDCLLRAQCNDAYWHGVFGGLYAPHLRTELWRNLVRAEAIADRHTPGATMARVETLDYDADGAPELLFTSPESQTLLKPSDGATVAFFDFRSAGATLINSITRRHEAYHARVRQAANQPVGHVASIHDQTRVKEVGLDRFLRYDRWPRHSFRVLLFDPAKTHANYETLELDEDAGFAAGAFLAKSSSPHDAEFVRESPISLLTKDGAASPNFILTKRFSFGPAPHGCELSCEVTLKLAHSSHASETSDASSPANFAPGQSLAIGIESVINFLAPDADDRFFESQPHKSNSHESLGHESRTHRSNFREVQVLESSAVVVAARKEFLRFSGELPAPTLRIEDGWQKVRITLTAPNAQSFWIAPIETVSESEEGFERVYQGSQILPVWLLNLSDAKSWTTRLTWRLEHL
jgi:4-alpha-glucanotransferase